MGRISKEQSSEKLKKLFSIVPKDWINVHSLMKHDKERIYKNYYSYRRNLDKLVDSNKVMRESSEYSDIVLYKKIVPKK